MELGFAGLGSAWPFEIIWHAVPETTQIGPFETKFARSDHSVQNHAILLRFENKGFAYSGDGNVTADTTALLPLLIWCFRKHICPSMIQNMPRTAIWKLFCNWHLICPDHVSGYITSNVM